MTISKILLSSLVILLIVHIEKGLGWHRPRLMTKRLTNPLHHHHHHHHHHHRYSTQYDVRGRRIGLSPLHSSLVFETSPSTISEWMIHTVTSLKHQNTNTNTNTTITINTNSAFPNETTPIIDPLSTTTTTIPTTRTATTTSSSMKRKNRSTFQTDDFIKKRTQECLDLPILLKHLRALTLTRLGKELILQHVANNAQEAQRQYAQVEELTCQLSLWPIHSELNMWPILYSIETNSASPTRLDLMQFTYDITDLLTLQTFLENEKEKLTLFEELRIALGLPSELIDIFHDAFEVGDNEGELNVNKYPQIRRLVQEITILKNRILQTLQSLLQSPDMKDKISDQGYTEMNGRFCLMLKNSFKKGVGIVHASSNTGRTLYVEPFAIVEPSNELKTLMQELRAEENKIFFTMCTAIHTYRNEIKRSLLAAAELDMIRAKSLLGQEIQGVVPLVQEEGVIHCEDAKHPLLILKQHAKRRLDPTTTSATTSTSTATTSVVVGNDIYLNQTSHAIVISGPNAGGKTIVLKTVGLYAHMVRYGIPIPAKLTYRLRIDYFQEILADIGDMQSVTTETDFSTFSGHLFVCKEMIKIVEKLQQQNNNNNNQLSTDNNDSDEGRPTSSSSNHSLILLDEIGTGTDPIQGQALAQAILEELMALQCRLIVTTHYSQLKELALRDPRFQVGAMEWLDCGNSSSGRGSGSSGTLLGSRPTYKMKLGLVGESHALELAERIFSFNPSGRHDDDDEEEEEEEEDSGGENIYSNDTNMSEEDDEEDDDDDGTSSSLSSSSSLSPSSTGTSVSASASATVLSTKQRLKKIILRAHDLLDDETQRLLYLQQQLDYEKHLMQELQDEYKQKLQEIEKEKQMIIKQQQTLEEEITRIRAGQYQEYLFDLKRKEQQLESYMTRAQDILRRSLQYGLRPSSSTTTTTTTSTNTTSSGSGNSDSVNMDSSDSGSTSAMMMITNWEDEKRDLDQMKHAIHHARIEAEKEIIQQSLSSLNNNTQLTTTTTTINPLLASITILPEKGDPIEPGTMLVILEPGNLYGTKAIVTQRNKGKGRVVVRVGGAEIKLERHLLGKPSAANLKSILDSNTTGGVSGSSSSGQGSGSGGNDLSLTGLSAKDRRFLQMVNEELVDVGNLKSSTTDKKQKKSSLTSSSTINNKTTLNTIDLRPSSLLSYNQAMNKIMTFIEQYLAVYLDDVYSHGHHDGSSSPIRLFIEHNNTDTVLKDRLREALVKSSKTRNSFIREVRLGNISEGGDDVTVLELDL